MRQEIFLKFIQTCFLFMFAGIANCQPSALYETDGVRGKFVFSRNYQDAASTTISVVIIADTFSLHATGLISQVTMSNAYVFTTKIKNASLSHSTNNIEQDKMFVKLLKMELPRRSQIISNNLLLGSSTGNSPKASITNSVIYEGDAAVKELKKLGLGLPDDYDEKKK